MKPIDGTFLLDMLIILTPVIVVPIIGICGGFQILGIAIQDPYGIENDGVPITADGLGLLSIRTVLGKDKTVRRVRGSVRLR